MKNKGWRYESNRHRLASKGIKTGNLRSSVGMQFHTEKALNDYMQGKQEKTLIVENMKGKNMRPIPNQFVIQDGNDIVFQSYKSKIAVWNETDGTLRVYPHWDYSNTTRKYFSRFLQEHTTLSYAGRRQFEKEIKTNPKIKYVETQEYM